MYWVAPTEKDTANETLEKPLCGGAQQFYSELKAGQHSTQVPGFVTTCYAKVHRGNETMA